MYAKISAQIGLVAKNLLSLASQISISIFLILKKDLKFYFERGDHHVDLSAFSAVAVVVAIAAVVVATAVTKPSTFTTSLTLHLLQQPRFFSLPSSL